MVSTLPAGKTVAPFMTAGVTPQTAAAAALDLEKLGAIDDYKEIARTPEFAAWKKSRR